MNEVARRDQGGGVPTVQQADSTLTDTLQLGEVLVASGFLPKAIRTKEQAAAIMLKGQELQLPPMQALSHIHIVDGRPTLSAELMAAMIRRAGHTLRIRESTNERCVVEGIRRDDPEHVARVEWIIEDAKTAGLLGKDPWKKYPRSMLRSRCISEMGRGEFADVLMGASLTPEEMGADVDSEGAVVEPPAPVQGIESRPTEPSHDELVQQVERGLDELPDASRPPREEVLEYARKKPANARAALERVRRIREREEYQEERPDLEDMTANSAANEEVEPEDEGRGEVAVEGEPGTSDTSEAPPIDDGQYTYIHDIAEELYSEKSERYSGVQYLERDIGKALTTLTRDEANALIRNLDSQYREAMGS